MNQRIISPTSIVPFCLFFHHFVASRYSLPKSLYMFYLVILKNPMLTPPPKKASLWPAVISSIEKEHAALSSSPSFVNQNVSPMCLSNLWDADPLWPCLTGCVLRSNFIDASLWDKQQEAEGHFNLRTTSPLQPQNPIGMENAIDNAIFHGIRSWVKDI